MKNKKNLILDDGKPRICVSNIAKMNLFEIVWYDNPLSLRHFDWKNYFVSCLEIVLFPIILLTYPVSVLVSAYVKRMKCRREVKNYSKKGGAE